MSPQLVHFDSSLFLLWLLLWDLIACGYLSCSFAWMLPCFYWFRYVCDWSLWYGCFLTFPFYLCRDSSLLWYLSWLTWPCNRLAGWHLICFALTLLLSHFFHLSDSSYSPFDADFWQALYKKVPNPASWIKCLLAESLPLLVDNCIEPTAFVLVRTFYLCFILLARRISRGHTWLLR